MAKQISLITLGLFIISLLSGLVLLFAYHPDSPYDSIQKIEYLISYGKLFREIHYFSSEAFFMLLLLHVTVEINKKFKIKAASWIYSVIGLFMVVALLFSGFVLKGDLSAVQAGEVAFSLIKDTPFINGALPLIKDDTMFVWKFFIFHSIFLPIILIYSIFRHIRYITPKNEYLIFALGITLVCLTIFDMPEDLPIFAKTDTVTSPWFFLGAENMLQKGFNPVFVNLFLALPFLFLLLIYKKEAKKLSKIALLIWLVIYVYFSI